MKLLSLKNIDRRSLKAYLNITLLILIKGCNILINLAYVPLLIHILNKEVYGIWLTLTTIISWLNFFDIGLGNGLRNKVAESYSKKNILDVKKYISTAYIVTLVISVFMLILFSLIIPLFNWSNVLNAPYGMAKELEKLVLVVVGLFCISFIFKLITSVLTALQMPALASFISTLGQLISYIVIKLIIDCKISVSLFQLGVIISVCPLLVMFMTSCIFFSGHYHSISPSFKYYNKSYIKSIFSLGVQFFVIQITALLLFQSNNIIIAHTCGNEFVTDYNIAYKYIGTISMIFSIIITPYWSACTDAYQRKDFRWIKRSNYLLDKIWIILVLCGIVMAFVAKYVYSLWLGEICKVDYVLIFMLLLYFIIYMRWTSVGSFINGVGKIRLQFYVVGIEALIHIPLAIFLGLMFGLKGIIISMILTNLPNVIWPNIQLRKLINGTAQGIWNK